MSIFLWKIMEQIKNGNIMRTSNIIFIWLILLMAGALVSCNSSFSVDIEDNECPKDTIFTSRMIFDGKVESSFDGDCTRASSYWKKGDRLYVYFTSKGNDDIDGYAEYDDESDEWELTYSSELTNTSSGSCKVIFIKDSVYNDSKELSHKSPVYAEYDGMYTKNDSVVKLKAKLRPVHGRIRFKGVPGLKVKIDNLKYHKSFFGKDGSFEYEDAAIDVSVNEDGFTEYLYCDFATDDRKMIIHSGTYYRYEKKCNESVLKKGESGCMELPMADKIGGWARVCELPEVRSNCIEDVKRTSARFTGELIEMCEEDSNYGFVWSTSENPTLEEGERVSDKAKIGKFEATISGLSTNTRYYVRAFVENSYGVRYGDLRWFKTGTSYSTPSIGIYEAFDITDNSASINCRISRFSQTGNHEFITGGCCFSTEENPTIENDVVFASIFKIESSGDTFFQSRFVNLKENTLYYVRAFVITETGHMYYSSGIQTFVTQKL